MIIYSVFEGLGLSLLTLIHSVMLCSSACASATSFSLSFNAIVILASSGKTMITAIFVIVEVFILLKNSFCYYYRIDVRFRVF